MPSDETSGESQQPVQQPVDCSTMQIYGANHFRGHASQDGSIVIECGIANTGNDHNITKIACAVAMNPYSALRLAQLIKQLVEGVASSMQKQAEATSADVQ